MLEVTAVVSIGLLALREFLAIESNPTARRFAHFAGLCAVPFLVIFAALVVVRIAGYLGNTPGS